MGTAARIGLLAALVPACLLAGPRNVHAQTVLGLTWDGVSGTPVAGATVLVRDSAGHEVDQPGTVSGPDGRFRLELGNARGPVLLIAEKPGYASSGPVLVSAGDGAGRLELLLELQHLADSRATFSLMETGTLEERTARILGWVRERDSARPVYAAEVRVLQTDRATTTDVNGMFVLDEIPPGEIALGIEHMSFAPEGHAFRTEPGHAYEVQVTMTPEAIPVEGVEVAVRSRSWYRQMDGLRLRMQMGLRGDFVTAEEIEARGYPPVEEAIRQLPGVQIIKVNAFENDVRFRNCEQQPVVYVDGVQVNQPEDGEPLRELKMVHPMDIQAVEVYRGAASVPPEFAGPDAMCGALIIWTRHAG